MLRPTEVLTDGSFLAQLYPAPTARRRNEPGIERRVIEDALDTPAGPGRETYRLITALLDEHACPAELLAATYHERWEIETALDEVRCTSGPSHVRSRASTRARSSRKCPGYCSPISRFAPSCTKRRCARASIPTASASIAVASPAAGSFTMD